MHPTLGQPRSSALGLESQLSSQSIRQPSLPSVNGATLTRVHIPHRMPSRRTQTMQPSITIPATQFRMGRDRHGHLTATPQAFHRDRLSVKSRLVHCMRNGGTPSIVTVVAVAKVPLFLRLEC